MSRFKYPARVVRTLGLLVAIAVIGLGLTARTALAQDDPGVVKVMTYNMDAGTDFVYFFALPFEQAVDATYAELTTTDFAGRAKDLAEQIAAQQPDLVSLQEVTRWQTISATGSPHVLADQLLLLMTALWSHHQFYRVVAVQNLTTLTAPMSDGSYLRFLDRNVVLARTAFNGADLRLSNIRMGQYAATIEPIPGFLQVNGWISVDASMPKGKKVRFFATHLESRLDPSDTTQVQQAAELIGIMNASPFPVILAGDFNSDASGIGFYPLDQTETAAMIGEAGYADAWAALYPPYLGLTWPLYLEDVYAGAAQPFERIDLIFAKGPVPLNVEVVGTIAPFPSDHAGVVATVRIEK